MELFTILIEKDISYYKGCKQNLSIDDWSKPMWIGHETTAKKYGKIIYEIKTKKKLKLINI